MKVYTCTFAGIYPVGACAVGVANDEGEARELLRAAIRSRGIEDPGDTLELTEVALGQAHAIVLLDGNY